MRAKKHQRWMVLALGLFALAVGGLASALGGIHFVPTAADNAAFWTAFWPQFAASAIAIAGGVPTGLFIQSKVGRVATRQAAMWRAKQTREVLAIVGINVENNRDSVVRLIKAIDDGVTPIGSGIDLGTFDALKEDFMSLVGDRWLRADLASWFHWLKQIDRLSYMYWDIEKQALEFLDDGRIARAEMRREIRALCLSVLEGERFSDIHNRVHALFQGVAAEES